MDIQSSPTQTSFLLPALVTEDLRRMTTAKATHDNWGYWVFFKALMGMLKPHIKNTYRSKIQEEYDKLQQIVDAIEADGNLSDHAKETKIGKVRFIFADNRESIIYDALPNIGLGPDQKEGEIDFKRIDIEKMAELIQAKKGYVLEHSESALAEGAPPKQEGGKQEESEEE